MTFKPFKGLEKNLPTVAEAKAWKLRSDQLYAVEWAWVMVEGRKAIEKPSLARKSPGLYNHARWLTKGNRTMRD